MAFLNNVDDAAPDYIMLGESYLTILSNVERWQRLKPAGFPSKYRVARNTVIDTRSCTEISNRRIYCSTVIST